VVYVIRETVKIVCRLVKLLPSGNFYAVVEKPYREELRGITPQGRNVRGEGKEKESKWITEGRAARDKQPTFTVSRIQPGTEGSHLGGK